MNRVFLLFFLFPTLLFSQDKVQIVDTKGEGVSYATLFFDNKYGFVADSLGYFVPKAGSSSLRITAIGFEEKNVKVSELSKKLVLTHASYALSEVKVKPQKSKRTKLGHSFGLVGFFKHFGVTNYEVGEVIKNPKGIVGVIEKVSIKAGFDGEGGALFRLIIYDLDEGGKPNKNLMKENVIVKVSGKIKSYSFDIAEQNIYLPEGGALVGLEILNPSKTKFRSGFIPVFGFKIGKSNGNTYDRNEYTGGWRKMKDSNPLLFSIDVRH